jgi:hypothetical protein
MDCIACKKEYKRVSALRKHEEGCVLKHGEWCRTEYDKIGLYPAKLSRPCRHWGLLFEDLYMSHTYKRRHTDARKREYYRLADRTLVCRAGHGVHFTPWHMV